MLSSITSQFSESKRLGYSKIPSSPTPKIAFISNVPEEILFIIFRNLNIPDLININETDKKFKKITDLNNLWEIFVSCLNICHSNEEHVLFKKIVYHYYRNLRFIAKIEDEHRATRIYLKKTKPDKSPTVENIKNLSMSLKWVDKWKFWHSVSLYNTVPKLNDKEYIRRSEEFAGWILYDAVGLNQIKILNCHQSNLSSCPAEISLFPSLKGLIFSSNYLQEIPEELGMLNRLMHLNLSKNNLKKLPESLVNLKNLTFLDISNNDLENLPKISKLTKLKKLMLSDNLLSKMPKKLHHLTNLKTLFMFNNFIKEPLPVQISTLPYLKHLAIDQNQMSMEICETAPKRLNIKIIKSKNILGI